MDTQIAITPVPGRVNDDSSNASGVTVLVRTAKAGDFSQIMSLLMEMHAENAHFRIDIPMVQDVVANCIRNGFALVLDRDGEIIGTAGLFVNRTWYSRENYITDFWFYLSKDNRGHAPAMMLLNGCKSFARSRRMAFVLGVFSKERGAKKTAFFARHMEQIGGFFYQGVA